MAPDRPRADDVRRFCLVCSARNGRLVKRVCPALEHKRAAAKDRSTMKRQTKAAQKRERRAAEADLLRRDPTRS